MTGKPVRIQRSRAKGSKLPTGAVCVTRPGKWGNPFRAGSSSYMGEPVISEADAVAAYRDMLMRVRESGALEFIRRERLDMIRRELRGKTLACWCKIGDPCHADVLLEIANEDRI